MDFLGADPAGSVLAANDVPAYLVRGHLADRPDDLHLLVAQRVGIERRRRLHGDEAHQLEQVVLEEVAACAGRLVERAAVLDTDRLGHRDLDMVDVAAVPDRLEDAIAEAEDQEIADRLLAEVVIDPVDLRLAEDLAELAVEPDRRIEVVAERLFDDDPSPATLMSFVIEPDTAQLADDLGELGGLGGKVVEMIAPAVLLLVDPAEAGRQRVIARRVVEVEAVIADPPGEGAPRGLVERQDPRILLEGLPELGAKRVVVIRPPADRQDDELVRQEVGPPQLVEGRDDLAMGQVAGGSEEDEGARVGDAFETKTLA